MNIEKILSKKSIINILLTDSASFPLKMKYRHIVNKHVSHTLSDKNCNKLRVKIIEDLLYIKNNPNFVVNELDPIKARYNLTTHTNGDVEADIRNLNFFSIALDILICIDFCKIPFNTYMNKHEIANLNLLLESFYSLTRAIESIVKDKNCYQYYSI